MHWPLPAPATAATTSPTWRAITSLLADGRLRTAGVSNFQPAHLDRIIAETGIVPAVNQIEAHPYFPNNTVRAASARHGIAVEAWRPLGRGAPLAEPLINQLAATHGKSSAQIILRWHIQRGDIIFPKTTRPDRMKENLDLFNFELSAEQTKAIDTLDQGPAKPYRTRPGHLHRNPLSEINLRKRGLNPRKFFSYNFVRKLCAALDPFSLRPVHPRPAGTGPRSLPVLLVARRSPGRRAKDLLLPPDLGIAEQHCPCRPESKLPHTGHRSDD